MIFMLSALAVISPMTDSDAAPTTQVSTEELIMEDTGGVDYTEGYAFIYSNKLYWGGNRPVS